MNAELIITDITRMAHNFICIAGITRDGKTIRPLYENKRINESWCCPDSQAIKPFTRISIDLDRQRQPMLAPHTEDWFIGQGNAQIINDCTEDEKKDLLVKSCSKDVINIFNAPILHVEGEGVFIQAGGGCRSIGTIKAKRVFDFRHRQYDGRWDYRLKCMDGANQEYRLKIVDLTFQTFVNYLRMVKNLSGSEIEGRVNGKIFHQREIFLRIGLSRGWDLHPDRCYLQITGIYPFPDYLDGKCFCDLQREIENTHRYGEIKENQIFYQSGYPDIDLPF